MDKTIMKTLMMAQMAGAMLDHEGSPSSSSGDTSTRVREEICPTCGDTHESNKHLYCSPECFKNRDKE